MPTQPEQSAMQILQQWFKEEHPLITTGDMVKKISELLEVEKRQLCDFWIEGNKQGWEQQTDWPEDAEKLYNKTFKQ